MGMLTLCCLALWRGLGSTQLPPIFQEEPAVTPACPERLAIHDVHGRLVRTMLDTQLPGGEHMIEWDRTNNSGHRVDRGVYFMSLDVGERSDRIKLVLID